MNLFKSATAAIFLGTSVVAFAGDGHGHSHDVPGAVQPQRGGRIQPALGGLLVEFVHDKATNTFKFFPTTGDMKAIPLSEVKLTVTVQRRRVDKSPTALSLQELGDHFEGTFDPQKKFPINVDVKVTYKGKDDEMKFIVDRS